MPTGPQVKAAISLSGKMASTVPILGCAPQTPKRLQHNRIDASILVNQGVLAAKQDVTFYIDTSCIPRFALAVADFDALEPGPAPKGDRSSGRDRQEQRRNR